MNPQLSGRPKAILPATELTDDAERLYTNSAKELVIQ
jgi:hypothetical protein